MKVTFTCIITVVGAQQQHKGMFLLNVGGGGVQIFPTVFWGGRFFSRVFSRGGALYFSPIDFAEPPPPRP